MAWVAVKTDTGYTIRHHEGSVLLVVSGGDYNIDGHVKAMIMAVNNFEKMRMEIQGGLMTGPYPEGRVKSAIL